MEIFTNWYNHEHRHTGLGLHTPGDLHFGLATDKAADRRAVLTDSRTRHPHRFGITTAPKILDLPGTSWINRPAQDTTEETDTSCLATYRAHPPEEFHWAGKAAARSDKLPIESEQGASLCGRIPDRLSSRAM